VVTEVIAIFEQLHQLRYPIEKIRAVNYYPGAHDGLSMEDNNTSAFNCRGIPGPADGLSTPTVELSTSTRCSTPTSTARAHSNPRTPRHTWTATAVILDSCTTATRPYTSSPIEVGAGAAPGELPSTISTSSTHER
jgi:hypothetical protein